jgi:UDP-N-acetylmuramoyl-tripeptide--D-alanyl-D-alanine ligase
VRVWTNVGEAHLGFFASVDGIADAKAEIMERASAQTLLVANADDPRVMARAARFAGRTLTFGMDAPADVRAVAIENRGIGGTAARVQTPRGEVRIESPLPGRSNLANLLAAAAVAVHFDVPLDEIAARAGGLRAASHRGEVIRLHGVTVIDDSYNANPTATRKALELLTADTSGAARVAVLGEMLELGAHAAALHEDVGRAAASAGLDQLIAVGGQPAEALANAAIRGGLARERVHYVSTSDEAADLAARLIRRGALVLVKGSRGVRTDRVVDRLKAELA